MKALLILLVFSFAVAILYTLWKKTQKKPEIPDKPLGDSADGDDTMPDGFNSDDSESNDSDEGGS